MRLIDADASINSIKNLMANESTLEQAIDAQPTAFDMDKVLEEFNKRIDPNVDMDTGEQCNNWVVDMQNEIIGELGKTVLAGGIEHDTE